MLYEVITILRDSRKSFEQGLPGPGEPQDVATTDWGYVSIKQNLVNGFSTVITSYSIHYTKLYEITIRAIIKSTYLLFPWCNISCSFC